MFESIEKLEKEIEQFHRNIADSNELIEALKDVTSAIRELDSSHSQILEKTENDLKSIPDKMIEDNNRQQAELISKINSSNEAAKGNVLKEYAAYSKKIAAYNKEASALLGGLTGLTNQLSGIKAELSKELQYSNDLLKNDIVERITAFTHSSDHNVGQLIQLQNSILKDLSDNKSSIANISALIGNAQEKLSAIEASVAESFSEEIEKRLTKIESEVRKNSEAISELNQRSENMMNGIEKGNKTVRIFLIVIVILLLATLLAVIGFSPKKNDVSRSSVGMSQVLSGGLDSIDVTSDIDIPQNYIGELKNNMPNGNGTYEFDDGATYVGTWAEGKVSGEGVFSTNSYKLEGSFTDNKLISGTDTVFNDEAEVTFNVSDGIVNYNNVTVVFSDKTKYTGEWNEGISGRGNIEFSNGDEYSGVIQLGKFNDSGVYTWKNGSFYDGEWNDGAMNGTGTYYYSSDKSRYLRGSFENNLPIGEVKYYYKSHTYTSVWNNGQCSEIKY